MRTALIVIDVQESFRARKDDWETASAPDIVDRLRPMVELARSAGSKVVWLLHTEPGTGTVFDPDLGLVRLMDGLTAVDGEPVLCKTSHNAFTTTNLGQLLTAEGVTDLVVTGIKTEQCCETTARLASDLGYRVKFVLDGTVTMPLDRWDGSGKLSTEEVLDRTASALHGRFAEVVCIKDAMASWM
ncbi:MAG: cysteine hydrolase family protein [Jatrophihabitans sp.]